MDDDTGYVILHSIIHCRNRRISRNSCLRINLPVGDVVYPYVVFRAHALVQREHHWRSAVGLQSTWLR